MVLDMGITREIVRLGSRSKDDTVASYSIEALEQVSDSISKMCVRSAPGIERRPLTRPHSDRQHSWELRRSLQDSEQEMSVLLSKIRSETVSTSDVEGYLELEAFDHLAAIKHAPEWTLDLFEHLERDGAAGWHQVGQGSHLPGSRHLLRCWVEAADVSLLERLRAPPPPPLALSISRHRSRAPAPNNRYDGLEEEGQELSDSDESDEAINFGDDAALEINSTSSYVADHAATAFDRDASLAFSDPNAFFLWYGTVPAPPSSSRPLEVLLEDPQVWSMSRVERATLYAHWEKKARFELKDRWLAEFESIRSDAQDVKTRNEQYRTAVSHVPRLSADWSLTSIAEPSQPSSRRQACSCNHDRS